jgi:hypothetical protein
MVRRWLLICYFPVLGQELRLLPEGESSGSRPPAYLRGAGKVAEMIAHQHHDVFWDPRERESCIFHLSLAHTPTPPAGEHPAAWVLRYTLHSAARSTLAAFWLTSLAGALPAVVLLHRRAPSLPHILLRKLFHALAIVMFAPAVGALSPSLSLSLFPLPPLPLPLSLSGHCGMVCACGFVCGIEIGSRNPLFNLINN